MKLQAFSSHSTGNKTTKQGRYGGKKKPRHQGCVADLCCSVILSVFTNYQPRPHQTDQHHGSTVKTLRWGYLF